RGALERVLQAYKRLKIALGVRTNKDFTMKAHQQITTEITPRRFLELCLAENARRLDRYDARLVRPRLVPTIAKAFCRLLPLYPSYLFNDSASSGPEFEPNFNR